MSQERLPKQALLAKVNRKDQLVNLELNGPITLRNLVGIAWYLTQEKLWKTVKFGGLISTC